MKRFVITALIVLSCLKSFSQIRSIISKDGSKLLKESGVFNAPHPDKLIEIKIDKERVLREAAEEERLGMALPYRFGENVRVDYNLENSGNWHLTEDGRIWKLKVKSPGAYSLNLIFRKLSLVGRSELYIYNNERTMLYGPITSAILSSSEFQTDLIKGETIILELFEPSDQTGQNILHLTSVIHGFRDIVENTLFGQAFGCHDDVSCNATLTPPANGVAMIILANGTRICSGSLLNNGCQDYTPNILTAFHCVDIGNNINNVNPCTDNEVLNGALTTQEIANSQNWFFRFQYRRATCNSGPEPTVNWTFQNGATFRSAWVNTDFALVQMNQNPTQLPNTGITYLGWSRTNTAPTSAGLLGHPNGDVMKVSPINNAPTTNNTPLLFTSCQNPLRQFTYPANTHWTGTINDGALEGGMSGGPLVDQTGRVVGQLHGGIVGCAPTTSHSGRLDVSWAGGGTAQTSLGLWLTNNPSIMTTNTIGLPSVVPASGTDYKVCSTNKTFNLINAPVAHIAFWTVTSNLTIMSSTATSVTVKYSGTARGVGTITANVQSSNISCIGGPVTPISASVQAGPFNTSQITVSGQAGVCNGNSYNYYANVPGGHQAGYTYSWTYPSGWTVFSQGGNAITLYVPQSNSSYGTVRVSVNNGCGASDYTGITVYPGFGCFSYAYRYSPNPVKDELTVEAIDPTEGKTLTGDKNVKFEVSLYDAQQSVVAHSKSNKNKVFLTVKGLKRGMYILKIFDDQQTVTERLLIE